MNFAKPDCGVVSRLETPLEILLKITLGVGTVIGAGAGAVWAFGEAGQGVWYFYYEAYAINYPFTVSLGAAAGTLMAGTWVVSSALQHLIEPDGVHRCYAGVLNEIVRAFSSAWDYVFPWTAEHERYDVVLNAKYWDIPVLGGGQPYVWCADNSPLIRSYQRHDGVIGAALGSIVGAVVGGLLGIGVFGPMVAGLLACLAAFPIGFLCLLFAFLLIFLVSAASTVVAAILGGNFGHAVGVTTSTGRGTTPLRAEVGTFLTVKRGNLVQYGADYNAVVAYWAHDIALCGQCRRANPPFSFEDADQPDACPCSMSQPTASAIVENTPNG